MAQPIPAGKGVQHDGGDAVKGVLMRDAIFLSASIPQPDRHPKYFESMDVVAIREAVLALATVALPSITLCWGGHPSITPLVSVIVQSEEEISIDAVRLFQSLWFEGQMPPENETFQTIEYTPKRATLQGSIAELRDKMLRYAPYKAGIFIGGMEGVEEEYHLFRELHPNAPAYPIASTGAAALELYESNKELEHFPESLHDEIAYHSLFRELLRQ